MKTRFSVKSLASEIETLNAKLEASGHEYRFVIGQRNNYTAIDLATPQQMARYCCQRNLECGTPLECLNACYQYVANNLISAPSVA